MPRPNARFWRKILLWMTSVLPFSKCLARGSRWPNRRKNRDAIGRDDLRAVIDPMIDLAHQHLLLIKCPPAGAVAGAIRGANA